MVGLAGIEKVGSKERLTKVTITKYGVGGVLTWSYTDWYLHRCTLSRHLGRYGDDDVGHDVGGDDDGTDDDDGVLAGRHGTKERRA